MPGDDDYLLMIRAFRACIFSQMKSSFGKLSSRDDLNLKENRYCLLLVVVKKIFGPRSCISELQLKVNCRKTFGLLVCWLCRGGSNFFALQFISRLQFTFNCYSLVNDLSLWSASITRPYTIYHLHLFCFKTILWSSRFPPTPHSDVYEGP